MSSHVATRSGPVRSQACACVTAVTPCVTVRVSLPLPFQRPPRPYPPRGSNSSVYSYVPGDIAPTLTHDSVVLPTIPGPDHEYVPFLLTSAHSRKGVDSSRVLG